MRRASNISQGVCKLTNKYENITFGEFVDLFKRFLVKKRKQLEKHVENTQKPGKTASIGNGINLKKSEKITKDKTYLYNGLEIISLDAMAGEKIAKRCGNMLFVSPAMFKLIKEAPTKEERVFVLRHIRYHNYTLEKIKSDPLFDGVRHRIYKEDFKDHTVE